MKLPRCTVVAVFRGTVGQDPSCAQHYSSRSNHVVVDMETDDERPVSAMKVPVPLEYDRAKEDDVSS